MSETLSYQEPASTELNPAEQEALAVGEQMEADQNQLLAGKYKSAGDLEKAYLELQQKFSQRDPEPAEEESEEEPEAGTEAEATEEVEQEQQETEEPAGLTQDDIDYLHDLAGGADGYKSMVSWASENLEEEEVRMYDSIMDAGDPAAVYFAVKSLVSQYTDANGKDGKLLTGKAPAASADKSFRSQAELVQAMNDPRYDMDEAYRADVMAKLENSNLQF